MRTRGDVGLFHFERGQSAPEQVVPTFSNTEPWTRDALCRQVDPELFYPEVGSSSQEARSVCQRCPVRVECLEYALARDERFGVWGGMSSRQRKDLRLRRKKAKA